MKLEDIQQRAIKHLEQEKGKYVDSHNQQRLEQINSLGKTNVHVTDYKGELTEERRDVSDTWTISTNPDKEGWETDAGCTGYGLYAETAEYYAMCINEYPKLLSLIDRYKEAMTRVDKGLKRLSTGDFSVPMELSQIEAYQAYAKSLSETVSSVLEDKE